MATPIKNDRGRCQTGVTRACSEVHIALCATGADQRRSSIGHCLRIPCDQPDGAGLARRARGLQVREQNLHARHRYARVNERRRPRSRRRRSRPTLRTTGRRCRARRANVTPSPVNSSDTEDLHKTKIGRSGGRILDRSAAHQQPGVRFGARGRVCRRDGACSGAGCQNRSRKPVVVASPADFVPAAQGDPLGAAHRHRPRRSFHPSQHPVLASTSTAMAISMQVMLSR